MIKILDRISEILKLIKADKSFLKEIFKGGRSISSRKILLTVKNYIPHFGTIIDVGANAGQFALASSKIYSEANIYSFEALPSLVNKLKDNTKDIKNISIFNFALGDKDGEIEFFQNEYSLASSALEIHSNQTDLYPETSKTQKITVASKKLDSLINEIKLVSPALLKLDVQGYEMNVLKGAVEFLKNVDYLLFETSFTEMYNSEPLFDEMNSFVRELGFEIIAPVGLFQSDNLQILQMDILYKKKKISIG